MIDICNLYFFIIYIDNILTKLTTIGALYLTAVCLLPEFLIANYPIPFYLGGTAILIVVVVSIDTKKNIFGKYK